MGASETSDRQDLERGYTSTCRRVRPADMPGRMLWWQYVEPPPDPQEGRDANSEFMLRNAGVLWP